MDICPPSSAYDYSRLPSPTCTRLIELQPAVRCNAPIVGKIHIYDLQKDVPPYEALSYTWGASSFPHTLRIQDDASAGGGIVPITQNLLDALLRFRSPVKTRLLWVDAVCINQKDDAEKSTHIPLMTEIYRGAAKVLVWLGGNWPEEEKMLNRYIVLGRRATTTSMPLAQTEWSELFTCALAVVSLSWFSRRWIIQEVVLNANIAMFCGESTELSFLKFAHVLQRLPPTWSSSGTASLVAMYDLWRHWAMGQESMGQCGLLRLIDAFEHFGCMDGRDRIFTLATLAEDITAKTTREGEGGLDPSAHAQQQQWNAEVLVNYANTVEEVYTRTAEMIVNSGHLLWLLGQTAAHAAPNRPHGMPSWVPDWRTPAYRRPFWVGCKDFPRHDADADAEEMWPSRAHADIVNSEPPNLAEKYTLEDDLTIQKHGQIGITSMNVYEQLEAEAKSSIHSVPGTKAHSLHADFWCVEDFSAAVPKYLADTPSYFPCKVNIHKDLGNDDFNHLSYASWYCKVTSSLASKNALTPLSVVWKSKDGYPDTRSSGGSLDQLRWLRDTFSAAYEWAIPPDKQAEEGVWQRFVEKFAYVVTGGGMFIEHLGSEKRQEFRDLANSIDDDDGGDSETRKSTGMYGCDSWKVALIMRRIILGKCPPLPSISDIDPFLKLVTLTMRGRCLFLSNVDWQPTASALEATIVALGVGPPHLQISDRVLSPTQRDRGNASNPRSQFWPRRLWGCTYLVRQAGDSGQVTSRTAGHETDVVMHQGKYSGFFGSSVYCWEFVGDCFLSTSGWISPDSGLHRPRWSCYVDEKYESYVSTYTEIGSGIFDLRNATRGKFSITFA
ncbi:heterokaryon incompatibility protein-domain-containing protein [Podospora didyma]|uniref:Heterokaryon incompatibility protein-domain-containing protein n=1 Tax=Podospora didyma TaxID=330526 RepID=A0AAE0P564_9PEZI|nr:heterokaryon incompatibility protein-domain-containing protein [Podospora didyma]